MDVSYRIEHVQRGRPMAIRSEQSRRAILQSTMKLLDERQPESVSIQQLSIERIAREAGVSKTTIYRWWPNKAAVIIDTFLENHILATPVREDLPAIDALREHFLSLATVYAGFEGRLMAQLLAECQYDPATLEEFKKHFWRPRRKVVSELIERAIEEGSIRTDRRADEIAERIYAPIYFRLLFQEGALDADTMRDGFGLALEGIAAR
ncbi:AcrR family transcriptional regulator [Pseudoclavibacter chungangensis]|uniref:TetR/AcrR family transcriptional regulator n=1 Tax=Pseudoclavibacter chungangensis TaxID=587635 RepID=UPI0015C6B27D|nr:TetR/AcrR family transcriptional regulator [Pseudoclavibacter chungangensis]NYJ67143.1 AcrR family transcriptional regulator [Pseudoclavibacter chungangensis]